MEQSVELDINLFGDQLPSTQNLGTLSRVVHSSEPSRQKFTAEVEAHMSKTSPATVLAVGIGLFILGRYAEAVRKLEKAPNGKEKFMYLASAQRCLRDYEAALKNLQQASKAGADALTVNLEKATTYRNAGDVEAAAKELKACANFENVSAEYHYQLARLQEIQGEYDRAVGNYKTALELAPEHQRALFHLAYRHDLSGYEDAAIGYYKQIVADSPVYVSALLNLAVLYEDRIEHMSHRAQRLKLRHRRSICILCAASLGLRGQAVTAPGAARSLRIIMVHHKGEDRSYIHLEINRFFTSKRGLTHVHGWSPTLTRTRI